MTQDRYQVYDSTCGLISVFAFKDQAQKAAHRHQEWCQTNVKFFDRMERYGHQQEWTFSGDLVSRRPDLRK